MDKKNKWAIVIALFVLSYFTEGSWYLTIIALIFYYGFNNKPIMIFWYMLFCGLYPASEIYQRFNIFVAIIIGVYSGKQGKKKKDIFYRIYPAHIWFLYLLYLIT